MAQPLRLGLVGAGPWGRNYIRTIAGLAELKLARVASRNPRTPALVPRDCVVSADWREVVRAADLDGVIVAAPPSAHAEITLAAIEAGRPVLVEKPLALGVASAERIVAAAAARPLLVMVDHVHLFHPAFQALKRAVAAHGPVRAIHARAGDRGPYRPDVPMLWDWGPHDVAMCIDLLGAQPEAVDAERLERRPAAGGMAEYLRMSLRFTGGAAAEIRLSTLHERHRSFDVQLDSQILQYDGSPPEAPRDLPLTRAVLDFAAAIAGGSASLASVELGAAVVRTLARCEARLAEKS
ncbi:MAG: Gfo/Idh/MocA family oxidoreductase [Betaproteobacteria bacterium]|nr:Gfo/Idh/MocA family oxidoreductase [Betaproteobacteria bacterium]